ncbi:MAG: Phage protein [uncultured Clostridium sp.]
MEISEILKETQQDVYINLERLKRKAEARTKANHQRRSSRKNKSKKTNIGNVSIEELMSNRCYRRGRGGAIKQVR